MIARQDLEMLSSLREETEGKLQMLLSLRKKGLTSLFKEVRVFKERGLFSRIPKPTDSVRHLFRRIWRKIQGQHE